MPRNIPIYVGDKVRTPHGDGIVEEVYTWRDKVIDMSDAEAREFCDQCQRNVGWNYKNTWAEVFVSVGGMIQRYLAPEIKVLKGRDGKA
jgi:hypothetical protein